MPDLSGLHARIDAYRGRRAADRARALDDLHDRVLSGEEPHPEAPHPDEAWRARSARVWRRVQQLRMVDCLPWHHPQIWLWAASCALGAERLEEAIVAWEARAEAHARFLRRHARRRRSEDGELVEYVYEDGDEHY